MMAPGAPISMHFCYHQKHPTEDDNLARRHAGILRHASSQAHPLHPCVCLAASRVNGVWSPESGEKITLDLQG
jgi:hypothetical protein